MGWANCGEDSKGRPIGYAHEATCDHPGCDAKIDRGLSYACGDMHGTSPAKGSFDVCEDYFCGDHRTFVEVPGEGARGGGVAVCAQCRLALLEAKVEEYADVLKALANRDLSDFSDWDRMVKAPEEPGEADVRQRMVYEVLCHWGDVDRLEPDPRYMTPSDYDDVKTARKRDAEFHAFLVSQRPETEPAA